MPMPPLHIESEKRKTKAFIKTKLLIAAVGLNILALGFNILLTTSSLEKLYVDSLVSSTMVVARDFQRNVEKKLKFGKKIDKLTGVDPLIAETVRTLRRNTETPDDAEVSNNMNPQKEERHVGIAFADGTISRSTSESVLKNKLPMPVQFNSDPEKETQALSKDFSIVEHDGIHMVLLPLRDRQSKWVGSVFLTFGKKQIRELVESALFKSLWNGVLLVLISSFLLMIGLMLILPRERNKILRETGVFKALAFLQKEKPFPRKRLSLLLLCIILLCQIVFSAMNTRAFMQTFREIKSEQIATVATLLKDDIEFLLGLGLKLNKLVKMEVQIAEIVNALPEVSEMSVVDKDGSVLYGSAGTDGEKPAGKVDLSSSSRSGDPYLLSLGIHSKDQIPGRIVTRLSADIVNEQRKGILLDTLTVLTISILFSIELLIIIFRFLDDQGASKTGQGNAYKVIRPLAFALLFAVALTVSFLPLHLENIYRPLLGLPKNIVIGLPISAEMLFTLLVLFPCANWMERRGWHEPFIVGLFIAAIAIFLSGIARGPAEFIMYRGLLGIGYGMSWMSAQGFVIANTTDREKASGMSNLVAGIFAGSICGGSAGGMLAERIGFPPVFFIASGLLLLLLFCVLVFMRGYFSKPKVIAVTEQTSLKFGDVMKFFASRNVLSSFLFSIVPTSICVIGILYYMSPVYLNSIGTTQSNIGRAFMVYGLCMIYIAPLISQFVDRYDNKKIFIMTGGLCAGLGLGIFNFFGGLWATLAMIFLLGLASSFASSSQLVYVLDLQETKKLGSGKVVSFQRVADKLGQMLGPLVFGFVTGMAGIEKGIAITGMAFLFLTVLFILGARKGTES